MIAWIKLGASARIDGLTTKESTKAVETWRSRIGIARCRSGFSSANLRTPRRIQKSAKAITRIRTTWNRNAEGTRLLNALDAFSCEENDSPLSCIISLPRPHSPLHLGGLSLRGRLS